MWAPLPRVAVVLAGVIAAAAPGWSLWRTTTACEWYASGILTMAEAKFAPFGPWFEGRRRSNERLPRRYQRIKH